MNGKSNKFQNNSKLEQIAKETDLSQNYLQIQDANNQIYSLKKSTTFNENICEFSIHDNFKDNDDSNTISDYNFLKQSNLATPQKSTSNKKKIVGSPILCHSFKRRKSSKNKYLTSSKKDSASFYNNNSLKNFSTYHLKDQNFSSAKKVLQFSKTFKTLKFQDKKNEQNTFKIKSSPQKIDLSKWKTESEREILKVEVDSSYLEAENYSQNLQNEAVISQNMINLDETLFSLIPKKKVINNLDLPNIKKNLVSCQEKIICVTPPYKKCTQDSYDM